MPINNPVIAPGQPHYPGPPASKPPELKPAEWDLFRTTWWIRCGRSNDIEIERFSRWHRPSVPTTCRRLWSKW